MKDSNNRADFFARKREKFFILFPGADGWQKNPPSGQIRRGYGKGFFQTALFCGLHLVEPGPEDAAEFNVVIFAFKGDLLGGRQ